MRSIGKRNINILQGWVKAEIKRQVSEWNRSVDYKLLDSVIWDKVNNTDWLDLWEGAYSEINNIIDDITGDYAYGHLVIS